MFYDYFDELCKQKGISASKACTDMGLSRAVASKWKSTNTNPSMETVQKISKYFGVSTDALLMRELPEAKADDKNEDAVITLKLGEQVTEDELQQIKQFAEFVTKRKINITLENTAPKPLSEIKAKLEALNKAIQDFETADQEEEKTS